MRSARTTDLHRLFLVPLAVLSFAIMLGGCSSPLDVSEAERATAATCVALEPLPGVAKAACTVDDGGFDAGIRRKTDVTLTETATPTEAHHIITAWLLLREGGRGEYEVSGSRATSLYLTPATAPTTSFGIAPGTPAPGVAFVEEWLSRVKRGVPLSAFVGGQRTITVRSDGLSPAEQAALLDDFSMQSRTDRLVLDIGTDGGSAYGPTSIESPTAPGLGSTLRSFEDAYRGLAARDPESELTFTVSARTRTSPVLWFRIPSALAPTAPADQDLFLSPLGESIRPLLDTAVPTDVPYTVGISGQPGDVIGGFSTSGCTPALSGPDPRYANELQVRWSAIHGLTAPESCR